MALARRGHRIAVDVSDVPRADDDATSEVWFAINESGLSTADPRGENAGRRLAHAPVVRELRKIGTATSNAFYGEIESSIDPAWTQPALRYVAFVQRARSRRIVGAGVL